MSRNPKILWFATIPSLCIILVLTGVTQGSSVAIPNTFSADTVASAAEVNANFAAVATAVNDNNARITALETGTEQLFASNDSDTFGTTETSVGQKVMNSRAIVAPSAGLLLISGHVFINNDSTEKEYSMHALLDGIDVIPGNGFATIFHASADGSGGAEKFSLNYTIATPVTAGAHTVSQTAGPHSGTANWFHNAERLTVLFVSNGSVTSAPSPLIAGPLTSEVGD